MIGEHAAGHTAEISGNVQVERFLDAIGVKPARFRSGIKRPGICFFPINLTSGFRLYPLTFAVVNGTGSTGLASGAENGSGCTEFVRASKHTYAGVSYTPAASAAGLT